MNRQIETIIIGGGQAGLAPSYLLMQRSHEHIVLEQAAQAGNAWRNGRWDSFTLLTPNWSIRIPGAEYKGDAPDVFMERNEIAKYFERYVENFNLPVHYGIQVTSVEEKADKHGYLVWSDEDSCIKVKEFRERMLHKSLCQSQSRMLVLSLFTGNQYI